MTEMMKLAEKDIKAAIMNIFEDVKESISMMMREMGYKKRPM